RDRRRPRDRGGPAAHRRRVARLGRRPRRLVPRAQRRDPRPRPVTELARWAQGPAPSWPSGPAARLCWPNGPEGQVRLGSEALAVLTVWATRAVLSSVWPTRAEIMCPRGPHGQPAPALATGPRPPASRLAHLPLGKRGGAGLRSDHGQIRG